MQVYAIGNPFGLDHTLTQGIISGLGRELQTPGPRGLPLRNVIQTDAAINPGAVASFLNCRRKARTASLVTPNDCSEAVCGSIASVRTAGQLSEWLPMPSQRLRTARTGHRNVHAHGAAAA